MIAMVKIALESFLYIGVAVVYFFALIVATMILVKILGKEGADDLDHVNVRFRTCMKKGS